MVSSHSSLSKDGPGGISSEGKGSASTVLGGGGFPCPSFCKMTSGGGYGGGLGNMTYSGDGGGNGGGCGRGPQLSNAWTMGTAGFQGALAGEILGGDEGGPRRICAGGVEGGVVILSNSIERIRSK